MEHIVEYTLLYDFYGEMLTPHQKAVYEAALFDDLSLTEIAEEQGISRQGVHDLISLGRAFPQSQKAGRGTEPADRPVRDRV